VRIERVLSAPGATAIELSESLVEMRAMIGETQELAPTLAYSWKSQAP
jgi:hypothetical protein